jgi:hypothetical protein
MMGRDAQLENHTLKCNPTVRLKGGIRVGDEDSCFAITESPGDSHLTATLTDPASVSGREWSQYLP